MGPCFSKPNDCDPTPVFKIVHDRRCEDDYAYDDKLDKIGEGVQVRSVVAIAQDTRP